VSVNRDKQGRISAARHPHAFGKWNEAVVVTRHNDFETAVRIEFGRDCPAKSNTSFR
jgi:hypothetical protein